MKKRNCANIPTSWNQKLPLQQEMAAQNDKNNMKKGGQEVGNTLSNEVQLNLLCYSLYLLNSDGD